MRFALLHKGVTYLIAGLGLFALSLGRDLGLPILLAIAGGYAASYFAEGELIQRRSWATGWTLSVVALLALQLLRLVTEGASLTLAIEFAAYLQVSRLFNRRAAADYQQIAVLAFLHLIAATVLSTEIIYGLVFIGFVIVTPWMLALSHLRREIEGNYPVAGPDDERGREAIRRVLASRRVVGGRFLLGTVALSVPLFAMTVFIFLTLPRVGQGFLTFSGSRGQSVTGFGNQVELGGFGVIRDDPTVILRVQPQRGAWASDQALRMRGTAFDHYDGKRWTRSPSEPKGLRSGRSGFYAIDRPARDSDIAMKVVLDHLDEPVLFLPAGTVALGIDPRIVQSQRIMRRLSRAPGLDLRYGDVDGTGLTYTAFVDPAAVRGPLPSRFEEDLEPYLQLPAGHERVAQLARELTAGAIGPQAKVEALLAHLRGLKYSLDQPNVPAGMAPLDVFLFEARRGHCEYFSSALAIMLRSLGIPARNVTGFLGGRYNPYGDYYALRQGDAHSWVEAHLPERGWLVLEPTPASRASAGPRQNLWADVSAFVDAMRMRWVTSVLGYDVTVQMAMMRELTRAIAGSGGAGADDDRAKYSRPWRDARVAARRVGMAIGGLIMLGVVAWIVRRVRRHSKSREHLPADAAQAIRLYRELERVLDRRGARRPPERTPVEHAAHLRAEDFDSVDAVDEITRGYMAARYGQQVLTNQDLQRLKGAVRRIGQAGR